MTTLNIHGTDGAQKKTFLAEMKTQVSARVAKTEENTGGAAAAAARAVQDRGVSIAPNFKMRVSQAQSLIQDLAMNPSKALEFMIGKLLNGSNDHRLAVYFAYKVLSGLEVFSDDYKQTLLNTVTTNHPFLILDLKPAEQKALTKAYTAESGKEVDIHNIPHDFIIRHEFKQCKTSADRSEIADILTKKYGSHILTAQYAALQNMAEHANFEYKYGYPVEEEYLVDAARGEAYFKKQYGDTRELQLARMLEEFGKTPQEVNQDPNIPNNFVTLLFIEQYNELNDNDIVAPGYIFDTGLDTAFYTDPGTPKAAFRLPYSLTQHKNITEITINAPCTHIPGWFGELSQVKVLTITQEKPLTYVHDFSNFKGKLVIPELKRKGNDMKAAFAALASMKAQANDGLSDEDFEKAFCLNYGETPFQQLLAYVQENGKLPEAADLQGVMNADYLALSRDPTFKPTKLKRIPLALREHAKTFAGTTDGKAPVPTDTRTNIGRTKKILDLSNNQLTTLPKWLEEFGQIIVNVQKNKITTRAGFPFNHDSHLGVHDENIYCPLKFYLAGNPFATGYYYERHGDMMWLTILDIPEEDQPHKENSADSRPFTGY